MFNELSTYEWLTGILVGGGCFLLIWFLARKVKQVQQLLHKEERSTDTHLFDAAFAELKQAIDRVQTPILLIANDYAHSSISIRNQIKKNFSLVANSIAYEKNLYMVQHYNDVILDILRNPLFFQTIEDFPTSPISEIQIPLDFPKHSDFRLLFSTYDVSHILKNVIVVTLIDESQSAILNQMRSDFIAHASHELRTPLTSLDGFVQTLLNVGVDDPETQKKFLGIMQTQVARMIRLTNGLLSLSRVERDEHRQLTDKVDLKQILQQILQEIQFKVQKSGIILEYQDEVTAQEVEILADRDQVFQIIYNLFENAIRYAPLGRHEEATITCSLSFSEDQLKWPGLGWVVSIIDNGPGIEKKHIPRLTERFYRTDDKHGGTGLGLAIVKHIITRHKGAIYVESQLGKGSCFSVWFPMYYAEQKYNLGSGAVGED